MHRPSPGVDRGAAPGPPRSTSQFDKPGSDRRAQAPTRIDNTAVPGPVITIQGRGHLSGLGPTTMTGSEVVEPTGALTGRLAHRSGAVSLQGGFDFTTNTGWFDGSGSLGG